MYGDNLVGIEGRSAYSIIRAIAAADGDTDSRAAERAHAWQVDEGNDSTAVFPFQRGAVSLCPFNPSDVALALVSYRWERVALALAYHGVFGGQSDVALSNGMDAWKARAKQHV